MLKLIGASLLGFVCAYYGFISADRLKKRRDFLNEFKSSLSVIETEIVLGRYELGEIFRGIDKSQKLYGLYGICASLIEENGIRNAWKLASEKAGEQGCLKKEDISAVSSLGNELGMSDTDGQKKALKRAAELIKPLADNAGEEYTRLARVYRSCGVLAGIFIILAVV